MSVGKFRNTILNRCVVCFNQSTRFVVCVHCGKNGCCPDCASRLFADVEFFLEEKNAKCPLCKKEWIRNENGDWKNHVINRSFLDLVKSIQNILPEDPAEGGRNDRVTLQGLENTPGSSNSLSFQHSQQIDTTPSPGRRGAQSYIIATPNVQREEIVIGNRGHFGHNYDFEYDEGN